MAVSPETLLERRTWRDVRHAQCGRTHVPPLLLQVPKEEPIEISSDSSGSDVDLSELRGSGATAEARQ